MNLHNSLEHCLNKLEEVYASKSQDSIAFSWDSFHLIKNSIKCLENIKITQPSLIGTSYFIRERKILFNLLSFVLTKIKVILN